LHIVVDELDWLNNRDRD